jgi:hypothetical protein
VLDAVGLLPLAKVDDSLHSHTATPCVSTGAGLAVPSYRGALGLQMIVRPWVNGTCMLACTFCSRLKQSSVCSGLPHSAGVKLSFSNFSGMYLRGRG